MEINTPPKNEKDLNITKHMWDLYAENYNTVMKEIKESNKWRSICVHGLQDSNSIDVNSPLNLYTGLMQFASKSLQDFVNIDKISLNVM